MILTEHHYWSFTHLILYIHPISHRKEHHLLLFTSYHCSCSGPLTFYPTNRSPRLSLSCLPASLSLCFILSLTPRRREGVDRVSHRADKMSLCHHQQDKKHKSPIWAQELNLVSYRCPLSMIFCPPSLSLSSFFLLISLFSSVTFFVLSKSVSHTLSSNGGMAPLLNN